MKRHVRISLVGALLLAALVVVAVAGCRRDRARTDPTEHDHSDWWCKEHGVPEELCSLCLPAEKVKEMYKDKGDWCAEHKRAKSQCFKCDPALYEEFEKMFVAKYGKKPERPPASEFKK